MQMALCSTYKASCPLCNTANLNADTNLDGVIWIFHLGPHVSCNKFLQARLQMYKKKYF